MRKLLAFLFIFLGLAIPSMAQVSAITITGAPNCGNPGASISVTFKVRDAGDFGTVSYDILFSAATTADGSAYSSYLGSTMLCTTGDRGFTFFDNGNALNTITRTVTVPSSTYSGYIIIIAQENATYLTCSAPTTYAAFVNPCSTSTPTNTPTNTPTLSPTVTPTNSPTNTPTKTPTLTNTFTVTGTISNTATNSPTNTPTKTPTNSPTNTPTKTPSPTPTNSPTATPTRTPVFTTIPTSTWTPSGSATATPMATATYDAIDVKNWVVITPTGTITPLPHGQFYWAPMQQPSPGGGSSSANTPTITPTPNYTTTPSPTPCAFGFIVNSSASGANTIVAATAGYYNTLRELVVTNTTASTAGPFYVTDGTVTLLGPVTIGGGNLGLNIGAPIFSGGFNRPLIFFNSGPVTNMMATGQYSIDLPSEQKR